MNSQQAPSNQGDDVDPRSSSTQEPSPFQLEMANYRRTLQGHETAMQSEFDKYILTLSSGALALSITFLKEVLNQHCLAAGWLIAAWIFWAISICCVVVSFVSSAKAMRVAITQTDDMLLYMAANRGELGGRWNKATNFFNLCGGAFFLAGVVCMVMFSATNLNDKERSSLAPQAETQKAPPSK